MPQMMPINWFFLFILFLLIFYLFNIMNYYILNFNIKKSSSQKIEIKNFNWKW